MLQNKMVEQKTSEFEKLITRIPDIGYNWHKNDLIKNAKSNSNLIDKSIKELPKFNGIKKDTCIIISSGPSVRKQHSIKKILDSSYTGTIIAVDGSYVACLKAGLYPDYVITMDPHPSRVVRWFGDPDFEKHILNDDYFNRQDLDSDFRDNSISHNKEIIDLVNKHSHRSKLLIPSTSSSTVVDRVFKTNFEIYWWNPLVDNPDNNISITRKLWNLNKLPCINTGGTVGTVSWLIAATHFKIDSIVLVGMDFGYHNDIQFNETQTYYELIDYVGSDIELEKYFLYTEYPIDGGIYYSDPTYYWYKKNFLEIIDKVPNARTYNCTDGGTLVEEKITITSLNDFLLKSKKGEFN